MDDILARYFWLYIGIIPFYSLWSKQISGLKVLIKIYFRI